MLREGGGGVQNLDFVVYTFKSEDEVNLPVQVKLEEPSEDSERSGT